MHMMNQMTVKPLKQQLYTFTYCTFKYFKFAIQNSQIAIQKNDFAKQILFLHRTLITLLLS